MDSDTVYTCITSLFCNMIKYLTLSFEFTQAFKTQDSYILVGAGNDGQFRLMCKVRTFGI